MLQAWDKEDSRIIKNSPHLRNSAGDNNRSIKNNRTRAKKKQGGTCNNIKALNLGEKEKYDKVRTNTETQAANQQGAIVT